LPPGQGDRSPRRCVRRSSGRCGPASHRRRRSRSGSPAPLLCLDSGLEPPPGWLLNPRAARGARSRGSPGLQAARVEAGTVPRAFPLRPRSAWPYPPRAPAGDRPRGVPGLSRAVSTIRAGSDRVDPPRAPVLSDQRVGSRSPRRPRCAAGRMSTEVRCRGSSVGRRGSAVRPPARPGAASRRGGHRTSRGRGKRSDLAEAPTGQGPAPVETRCEASGDALGTPPAPRKRKRPDLGRRRRTARAKGACGAAVPAPDATPLVSTGSGTPRSAGRPTSGPARPRPAGTGPHPRSSPRRRWPPR
jgi:hypothetical protein